MTAIGARRLFTGVDEFSPGELVTAGDRIVSVGPPGNAPPDLVVDTLVPGFVDVHNHGGGGFSFSDEPLVAADVHRRHGSTTIVASLVSQPIDVLEEQVRTLAPLVRDGVFGGIHLEGPWLAAEYKGAHPIDALRDPVLADVDQLLDAGAGTVRMVTLAPERAGAIDAIRHLSSRGVVAALGHSGADYLTACAAIDAGVTGATHLFNAMPTMHHRTPGPVLALLDDDRVWLELIIDGTHVSPALAAWVARTYPERTVLITDSMAAACCGDGHYQLGDLPVDVTSGVARVSGTDTIAGSTITLDAAVRNGVEAGISWRQAIRSATVLPARYLGFDDVGLLAAGKRADAVALSDVCTIERVLHRGTWVER
jgi:N-acetylglucosamine-6-phosphate deacetylase